MLQIVEKWLRGSGSKWLLILDNADLEDVLFKPVDAVNAAPLKVGKKRVIDCLALPSCGQTVLTTRHKTVASKFVDECDVITVGPMAKPDAITLFRNKAVGQHDAFAVEKLVHELGYVPLAIAHAAAFIRSQVPPCPIRSYLNKLEETKKSDASLLTANYNELRRDPEADNSIINTWQISFEHIRQIRPSAADRLSLMSCYDHRSIPRVLILSQNVTESHPSSSASQTSIAISTNIEHVEPAIYTDALTDTLVDVELPADIATLYSFHLVSIGHSGDDYEIHPLVQLAARKWLKSRNKEDPWLRKSLQCLTYAVPDPTDFFSSQWRVLIPHLQLALTNELQDKVSGLLLAQLCSYAFSLSSYSDDAERSAWLNRCLAERTRYLGDDHLLTLEVELELSSQLYRLGEAEEAHVMLKHCSMLAEKYAESSRTWRSFHVICLRTMGAMEESLGHLADAETHLRRALGECMSITEHESIRNCVEDLKDVLLRQKKQSEAETVCRQALEVCKTSYGSEHTSTLGVSASLASVLHKKGDLAGALKTYASVCEAYKRMSPAVDPQTLLVKILSVMLSMSWILQAQGKMQEAADLTEQAYRMSSDRWGRESSLTLLYTEAYADALGEAGKHYEALEMMKSCATNTRRLCGPDHEDYINRSRYVAILEDIVQLKAQYELEQQGRRRIRDKCVVQ